MANLVELYDLVIQAQALNGVPLSHGHVYVYAFGRTKLMDTWSDIDGESLNPNPVILDNAGQAHIYVSDDFDYTLVFTDEFDNEVFSVDKYLLSKGEHSHADVAVAPSEHIGVSSYHVGEVTVFVPYLTGEVGKTYEGIDPIVVNNTLNRISANHIPLGVQDPLYFVEDSESACILGCSAQTEIPSALSSKWDEASDAVIANSAQWAEGTEYEAGSYVSIDNNTINVTGLQPEGDYAYNSALSSKLDVTALPQDLVHSGDLTAYYPIDNPSGFITGVDLTDYATTAQLDEKLDKTDSGNFYPMEGNPSGFLTAHQSLQGYATEQWVEDKGYITGVDIPESANWNATTQTVSANSAQWAGGTANPQIPVTGINGIKISESGDKVVFEVSGDYYPGNNPSGFITGVDLSDYATTAQVSEKLDTTAFSTVSGDFLTAVDLTPYQEKADMTAYATVESLTAKQDAGNYLSATDSANFLLTSDSGNFYPMNQNPSGYLTAHQSLADYQTTADMVNYQTTAGMTAYLTAVPDTYLQNTNLSTTDGKVTAISGIPLSAGGDVPEGVMVESGLEYNAVNEISGYNGSAIAQYGAEKQWLVHDDTLVHAANSAQYALGCNISAIAQLLGVDETVLWEGNTGTDSHTTAFSINEPFSSFKRIRFEGMQYGNASPIYEITTPTANNNIGVLFSYFTLSEQGNPYQIRGASYSSNNGTDYTEYKEKFLYWSNTSLTAVGGGTATNGPNIQRIVGIGRKQ